VVETSVENSGQEVRFLPWWLQGIRSDYCNHLVPQVAFFPNCTAYNCLHDRGRLSDRIRPHARTKSILVLYYNIIAKWPLTNYIVTYLTYSIQYTLKSRTKLLFIIIQLTCLIVDWCNTSIQYSHTGSLSS